MPLSPASLLIPVLFLPAPVPPAQAMELRTVVFLGDSLTAGLGLARHQSYPALVEARIKAEALPWKVVNAGVSGDTSAGARARLDWVFRAKPSLLFLCIGSNDGLRGLPLAEVERNLRAILERARKEGCPVMLAGAMLPENYGPTYREAFRALFPRLAKEYRTGFMPFLLEGVAMNMALNQPDGIHPNAEGAKHIAEQVWKRLEPELRRQAP